MRPQEAKRENKNRLLQKQLPQRILWPSNPLPLQPLPLQGTLRALREENTCHPTAIWLQPLYGVPKGAQDAGKTQDWPRIAELHMKGIGSVSPDSCIFPYTEECEIP